MDELCVFRHKSSVFDYKNNKVLNLVNIQLLFFRIGTFSVFIFFFALWFFLLYRTGSLLDFLFFEREIISHEKVVVVVRQLFTP